MGSDSSPSVDAAVQIRLQLAASRIHHREQIRGMVLFVIYFAVYSVNISRIIDWQFASVTYDLFLRAESNLPGAYQSEVPQCDPRAWTDQATNLSCWYKFTDLDNMLDFEYYFESHMPHILTQVRQACPECQVALTPMVRNVLSLTLEDYSCSDYEANAGVHSTQDQYTPREDCDEADANWVAKPTVQSAPCCNNETIVKASIILMMEHAIGRDVVNRQFDQLVRLADKSEADKPHSVGDVFAHHQITKEDGKFFQVIVSRRARLIGLVYKASWVEETAAPGLIVTSIEFWSYHGDIWTDIMSVVAVIFNALSATHNMFHIMQKSWREMCLSPHMWFIFATMLLPLFVTLTKGIFQSLTDWILLASTVQLLLLVRLTHECTAISAMKCLVRTLSVAIRELSVLMIVIALYVVILGCVYGQLFGVFDYHDYFTAVMDVVAQFSGGPVMSDGAQMFQPVGGVVTYLFTMLVLFLILSQVFITVLMDAWEVAREQLDESKKRKEMPPGFAELPAPSWDACFKDNLRGFLTGYSPLYQAYLPKLVYQLSCETLRIEAEEEQDAPILVSQAQIAKVVGVATAERLALRWGAKPIPAYTTNDTSASEAVPVQQSAENRQLEVACPTEPTGSVVAVDEMAKLRADIFCAANSAGAPIPYWELMKLSRNSLENLLRSFNCKHEREV